MKPATAVAALARPILLPTTSQGLYLQGRSSSTGVQMDSDSLPMLGHSNTVRRKPIPEGCQGTRFAHIVLAKTTCLSNSGREADLHERSQRVPYNESTIGQSGPLLDSVYRRLIIPARLTHRISNSNHLAQRRGTHRRNNCAVSVYVEM